MESPVGDEASLVGPVAVGSTLSVELAVGLEEAAGDGSKLDKGKLKEISEKATASAVEKQRSPEVVNAALFEATMYPLAVLSVAKGDPIMFDKLRSKLIKEGCGEYSRHLSTLISFDDWLARVYDWLNQQGQMDAVVILQKWRLSIVLDWAMGEKAYVKLYFQKYHGAFSGAVVLQHGTTDRCGMLPVPKTFVCSTGEMVVLVCRCRQRGCKYIPRKLMVLDGTGCLGAEGTVVR